MRPASNEIAEHGPLLIRVLRHPETAELLDEASWGLLLRQARTANVVGRTLSAIDASIPSFKWPARARQTFMAEKYIANHRSHSLLWEAEGLSRTLESAGVRPILLKGAAYVVSGFPFATYRHFGDIDILVARSKLGEVERLLTVSGWLDTKPDPYDQQYYRRWMHELPPMQHLHRGTSLDVHHAILPLTARYKPDSGLLIDSACQVRGLPCVDVLSPADMFLHAAAHLFSEGECENALRNLLDLHDLLELFLKEGTLCVRALVDRAFELDLALVLVWACRYLVRIFGLGLAAEITHSLQSRGVAIRSRFSWDWLFDAVFLGNHPSYQPPLLSLARQSLYIRGHLQRMPPGLLMLHLARKAWHEHRSETSRKKAGE